MIELILYVNEYIFLFKNMYVALWYKNGKPIHGYAWNDGGVVQASFPYNKAELTGSRNLGGMLQVWNIQVIIHLISIHSQVLQYPGDHNALGYWYEWVKYEDRLKNPESRQMVKCGNSMPLLWRDRSEGDLLGYVDNKTENSYFSHNGIAECVSP